MNFGQVQLRGAEDDHRVERTSHVVGLGCGLDVADLVEDGLEQLGETTVDRQVILVVEASDELVRLIAHAVEELVELFVGDAGQDGRVGDLVAVEVQDRQHDTVGARVDELVGLPAGGQRAVSASPSPTMAGTNRLGLFITAP